jgi:ribA/ribD-fused uncharacterized protein
MKNYTEGERITKSHIYFWSGIYSNWFECKFKYKGITFFNTEQAFMWEKAIYFGDMETAELIIKTPNPKENKALGRKVKNFNPEQWMIISFQVMVDVNYAKFTQNLRLKTSLLHTKAKTLVEASPVDKIWGIGLIWSNDDVLDERKWQGMNLLGKALMEVRKKIRSEYSEKQLEAIDIDFEFDD